jgi:GNAT superfamily N-acetyltransferase
MASTSDLPRLVELCRLARAELAAQERGGPVYVAREARREPVDRSLAATLADSGQAVVVGTFGGTVAGYGTGRTELLVDGQRLGVIDDLFVEEGLRGVGVGEAVMGGLLAWFAEQGCAGVDAAALPGQRATKNFFEGSGFTARLIVMHHRLDG